MPDETREEPQRSEEANQLYWHSDHGVNQIAEEMGISKGALYNLVNPIAADMKCPKCGSGMVYPNRTARDRGFLSCPSCGFEEELEALGGSLPAPKKRRSSTTVTEDEDDDDGGRFPMSRENTRILVGSSLIAVAAGVILTRWLRRD